MTGGKPLMQALKERQTMRDFSPARLPPQILSDLLWASDGVVSGNSRTLGFSRGFAVIVAKQSTQALAAMNRSLGREGRKLRSDDLVLQSLMVSFLMIMNNERRGRTVEAGLPDQHHPVHTGFLDAPDKTLGDGIQIRGTRRQSHRFHAAASRIIPKVSLNTLARS
jgi:hypothetical protein